MRIKNIALFLFFLFIIQNLAFAQKPIVTEDEIDYSAATFKDISG